MKSVRRIASPALAGALVLGGALVATPSATAAFNGITVVGGGTEANNFRVFAGELQMGDNEFLQIVETSQTLGTYTVRIWDDAEEAPGRPLLQGVGSCLPAGVPTAQVVCTFSARPAVVSVDFLIASGPTNVAIMDNASLALTFRGSQGSDYVQGGSGNDQINGLGGADLLYGGPGNDLLDGGPGDDYIEGESGSDDMRGGAGSNSLDAVDNLADVRVDCGGVPALLDFDKGLDVPTNCGANPTPLPPAPVEPVDPPAPGGGEGTVDGVPVDVDVAPQAQDDTGSVTINTGPTNPIFQSQLWWFGTPSTPPVPTFPPLPTFDMFISSLFPLSLFDVSIFPPPPPPTIGPVSARETSGRSGPLETVSLKADANGVATGKIPVPAGQAPGDYTLQLNGVTAAGAQMSVNVGVRLDTATPEPDPEPEESIAITSAKRGKAKQAKTITVRGSAAGLAGTAVTPRYRLQGAKKWVEAKPVTVTESGTFRWKLTTAKKVRIVLASGAIRSKPVVVAAVKR